MKNFFSKRDDKDSPKPDDQSNGNKKIKTVSKKRNYDEEYLKYGFIPSSNDPSLPFCLICRKTLSKESMVPNKLLRHMEANHRDKMNSPISYFENEKLSLLKQSQQLKKFMFSSKDVLTASFEIAQLIAKKEKAHSEAEEIILPALKIAAKRVLSKEAVEKLSRIPLSSKTIGRRIEDMSNDIESQMIQCFDESSKKWALQLDESTDISSKAQLLAFLSLQGASENVITISGKLKAFNEKLALWKLKIVDENYGSFPIVEMNSLKSAIKEEIHETLMLLSVSFEKYFPNLDVKKTEWVVNPFMQCEIGHLEEELQENLIDLRNDLILKRLFEEKELSEFLICLNPRFPKLSTKAVESLLPFGSSYLCEKGFSTLTEMKSKKRERLAMIDEEMRVCREEKNLSLVCRESKKVARH
nr:unnamed protein product [Papilio xuthus]